ncbi:hypothetical protein LCGC14_0251170 [marine sediment metagenome]|uniref:Uncharacterized protein n=1 Tax=marine sediment metagenome TaxID=412755 RepID=A0A0F9U478_9ZZZZ
MSFINVPGFVEDVALDDSDKVITVPAGERWELLGVYADLSTTTAVGVRQLEIEIATATGVLIRLEFGETQAQSVANKLYAAALGLVSEVHVAGEMVFEQLPAFHLVEGDTVRVFDSAVIDAGADDLVVQINRLSSSEK